MRRCPDIKKAKLQLNYAPKVELEDGINRFLNWAKDNYSKIYLLAVLPNEVRGFEDIKLKKAQEFLIKLTGMEKELTDS